MEILRAEKTWQQAAVYYIRLESAIKDFSIPANVEIDDHDKPDTKYILIMDGLLPVATCRLYFEEDKTAKIERVVVLEAYRRKGLGRTAVLEAEAWIRELGYSHIVITSKDDAVGFYEKLGYTADWSQVYTGGAFTIVYTDKQL